MILASETAMFVKVEHYQPRDDNRQKKDETKQVRSHLK